MTIDLFSSTGTKVKTMELPSSLFHAPGNWGLMHQAVLPQQANGRQSAAHVKTRGEVQGSTRKMFTQKHTGRARRGPVRSPLLRGGGKTFGPRNTQNYVTRMPKKMRHAALRSCLAVQAGNGAILALESYPDTVKTKTLATLLQKLPLQHGRRILLVSSSRHSSLLLSARNIPTVKTVQAGYLNPEDILNSRHIIFLVDALSEADKMFGKVKSDDADVKTTKKSEKKKEVKSKKVTKKPAVKAAGKKKAKKTASVARTKKSPKAS